MDDRFDLGRTTDDERVNDSYPWEDTRTDEGRDEDFLREDTPADDAADASFPWEDAPSEEAHEETAFRENTLSEEAPEDTLPEDSGGEDLSRGDLPLENADEEMLTPAFEADEEEHTPAFEEDAEEYIPAFEEDAEEHAPSFEVGQEESYRSPYDSYRFQNPEDSGQKSAQKASGSGKTSKKKKSRIPKVNIPRVSLPKVNIRIGSILKKLLIACGGAAALIGLMIGIAFGVDGLRRKPVPSEAKEEITLGRQDEETDAAANAGEGGAAEASPSAEAEASGEADEAGAEDVNKTGADADTANAEADETGADAEETPAAADTAVLPEAEEETDAQSEEEHSAAAENTASGTPVIADLVSNVIPSLVSVNSADSSDGVSMSGIIVSRDEETVLVATDIAAVTDTADISVTFCDGERVPVQLRSMDSSRNAVLLEVSAEEIPQTTLEAIQAAVLDDSIVVNAGETVYAAGNAEGYGETVTQGIVNASARVLPGYDGTDVTVIQTDAAVLAGNTGGALLNAGGDVIGMVCGGEDGGKETYALPVSGILLLRDSPAMDRSLLAAFSAGNADGEEGNDNSDEEAGFLGVTVITVPASPNGKGSPAGVYVNDVTENSPAEKAGILVGDIISAVDDTPIIGNDELVACMKAYKAGETVEMTIQRLSSSEKGEYEELKLAVTLGSRADVFDGEDAASSESSAEKSENGSFGGNYGELFEESDDSLKAFSGN